MCSHSGYKQWVSIDPDDYEPDPDSEDETPAPPLNALTLWLVAALKAQWAREREAERRAGGAR